MLNLGLKRDILICNVLGCSWTPGAMIATTGIKVLLRVVLYVLNLPSFHRKITRILRFERDQKSASVMFNEYLFKLSSGVSLTNMDFLYSPVSQDMHISSCPLVAKILL